MATATATRPRVRRSVSRRSPHTPKLMETKTYYLVEIRKDGKFVKLAGDDELRSRQSATTVCASFNGSCNRQDGWEAILRPVEVPCTWPTATSDARVPAVTEELQHAGMDCLVFVSSEYGQFVKLVYTAETPRDAQMFALGLHCSSFLAAEGDGEIKVLLGNNMPDIIEDLRNNWSNDPRDSGTTWVPGDEVEGDDGDDAGEAGAA